MEDCVLESMLDAVDRFPLREEFVDSLDHTDPVPLAFLLESLTNGGVPGDSNNGSGCGQQIGSAVPERAHGVVCRRPDASPTWSAQSTDRINRQGPAGRKD
uniref:Uncharacterized protein n=1 Tax=Triticum urartu TaxID=4572 RepID=A0A8R7PZK8_TRIUA